MRPVLHGDISCTARALLAVQPERRRALCKRILCQAEQADCYVQKNRRLHPRWGNGSLMAAARKYPLADEPMFDNTEYCQCTVLILQALINRSVL